MSTYTLTHKGWFGICPIFMSDPGDACPLIETRHWIFEPLMILSEVVFETMFMLGIGGERGFPLRITGEIEPRPVEVPE